MQQTYASVFFCVKYTRISTNLPVVFSDWNSWYEEFYEIFIAECILLALEYYFFHAMNLKNVPFAMNAQIYLYFFELACENR